MKGAFKNAILVAVVLVVCALLLEAMTRLFVDDGVSYELEMWKYATDVKVRDLRPDMGHKHGPNRNTSLMSVGVRTNEQGFRGPPIPEKAAAGVARIAFVGDSTTMGWGVAEKDTFANQVIDKLVKQGRKVDGFNEGVGNWNTTQELTNFLDTGLKMKPDIVVLTYFINDGEPIPTYPKESWLDLHSAAWIVLNYRLDSLIRQFGPRPDWKQYYRALYEDNAPGWKATQKAIAGFADVEPQHGRQDRGLPPARAARVQALSVRRRHRQGEEGRRGERPALRRPAADGREHGPGQPVGHRPRPASQRQGGYGVHRRHDPRSAADARRALPHREEGLLISAAIAADRTRPRALMR